MFRDLKEYQEIAKIYADKVSKPEDLEERVRGGGAPGAIKPFEKPSPQVSGRRENRPQMKGGIEIKKPTVQGAQGRTKRPEPEKSMPTTAEIRAKSNRVGGGNAGASTDAGLASTANMPKATPVTKKPEVSTMTKQGKERTPAQMAAAKRIGSGTAKNPDTTIAQVKQSNQDAMRARAKEKFAAFKAKRAEKKAAMIAKEEYTPYDIVLEYLLSTEQAATIEEANYVMTEMDAKTIQGIVEEQKKNSIVEKKGVFQDPKLNKLYSDQPEMTEKGKKILPNLPDPTIVKNNKVINPKKKPRLFGDPTGEITKDFFK